MALDGSSKLGLIDSDCGNKNMDDMIVELIGMVELGNSEFLIKIGSNLMELNDGCTSEEKMVIKWGSLILVVLV